MIPKKIYLNYVNEDDKEKTWSEEPVSVNDCDMQKREYTDLSQVWHDASEDPKGTYIVLCDGLDNRQWVVDYLYIDMSYANWQDYADAISVERWAYINDLLPKGGEE